MGWIQDILTEVPLSAVMKERLALAEQKYDEAVAENERLRGRVAELEGENAELRNENEQFRAQLAVEPVDNPQLSESELAILQLLYRAQKSVPPEAISSQLGIEPGRVQHWLYKLKDRKYVRTDLNMVTGARYAIGRKGLDYLIEGDHV